MTIVDTWATDIAALGPIYPMVGSELVLFIIGLVFWLYFHIRQIKKENLHYEAILARHDKAAIEKAVNDG